MKSSSSVHGAQNVVFLVILFLAAVNISFGLRPHQFSLQGKGDDVAHINNGDESHSKDEEMIRGNGLGMDMYPTGSSLPDCSHACGPCFPCKRVMISFKCSVESCPIIYRCSCKGKYYHVPSN